MHIFLTSEYTEVIINAQNKAVYRHYRRHSSCLYSEQHLKRPHIYVRSFTLYVLPTSVKHI